VPARKESEAAPYEAGIRGFASCEKRILVQEIPRPKAKSALGYMRTSLNDSPASRNTPGAAFPKVVTACGPTNALIFDFRKFHLISKRYAPSIIEIANIRPPFQSSPLLPMASTGHPSMASLQSVSSSGVVGCLNT
jgi:hypothetical protein